MNNKNNNLFVASDHVRNSCDVIVHNEYAPLGNEDKEYNSYTCFIPENLDVEDLIRAYPPSIPNFHIDYLVYMAGLIVEIPLNNKDLYMSYVPIYSKLVQKRVRHYRKYLDYLINCGVIIEDKQYIVGLKSKGFKFNEIYETKTKPRTLIKRTLIKSILEFKEVNYSSYEVGTYSLSSKKSNLEEKKNDLSYITNWLNHKLTIDYIEAEAYLLRLKEIEILDPKIENPNQKFMYRHAALLKFHLGIFLPNEDATAGRLHSAMTQIKSDLRPFIRYEGKKLVAIDIVNSQPYLSIILLNYLKFQENNILNYIHNINPNLNTITYPIMLVKKIKQVSYSENVRLFIELVSSGKFYEEFGKILKINKIIDMNLDDDATRKIAKKITFSAFFSPNTAISYREEIRIFKKLFPDVYQIFGLIKFGRGHHNTLAILLQSFEATLILHKACKIISEERPEAPIFTLHDSIITTEDNVAFVYEVIHNVLTKAIGVSPVLKVERWE